MGPDYKKELNRLVQSKKKEIPTSFSEAALTNIFTILEFTPGYLTLISKYFNDKSSLKPIIEGKRSFRETMIHLLNVEGLNYTTIYPSLILNKPVVYPLHAERDFGRLSLFGDFNLNELLNVFCMERKKSLVS
jgi:hypothetical protein